MRVKNKNILILFNSLFFAIEFETQGLKPRLFSAVPSGGNFTVISYRYSGGAILQDNTITRYPSGT